MFIENYLFYCIIFSVKRKDIYLILHNIRSAYNVGSIFRTADAVGVSKIFLCGITPTPKIQKISSDLIHDRSINTTYDEGNFDDKIAKTALGAEKSVPWEQYKQTWRLLKKLHKNKMRIVALEQAPKSVNPFAYKPNFPLVLIVGHERKGLSDKILNYVDEIMEIPTLGQKESLNVSVAAGIAIYQLKLGNSKKI